MHPASRNEQKSRWKKSRSTEEQIAYVLRQDDVGTPVSDVCRGTGISEATFYVWKKKYCLGVSCAGWSGENAQLKPLGDLTLGKRILIEVIAKSSEALTARRDCAMVARAISDRHEGKCE